MGFFLLTCSLFLLIKASYSIICHTYFAFEYVKKIGQVVGFSEEKKGFFQVVIRFLGINGKEYFFIDSELSSAPQFASGDFVNLFISSSNTKKGRFNRLPNLMTCFSFILWAAVLYSIVHFFYIVQFSQIAVILFLYFGLSVAARFHPIFSFFKFETEFHRPQILDLENSKLISWSDKYQGPIQVDHSLWILKNYMFKAERYLYLTSATMALVLSVFTFQKTHNEIKTSLSWNAVYDRPLMHQWRPSLRTKIPLVRYYSADNRIISGIDKQNPFYFGLKPGSKVKLLVSKKDFKNFRIDRGLINYWKSYLLLLLAIFLSKLNNYAKKRNANLRYNEPVIRMRKAG